MRRAVLDAAATLFAVHGFGRVSLRDAAAASDTHLALISRYIGNRAELELAVFDDLSAQLAESVLEANMDGGLKAWIAAGLPTAEHTNDI